MFDELREGDSNEYGDEAFESEDVSPIRRTTSGDDPRNVEKGAKDLDKDVALPAFDDSSEPELELEVSASSSDAEVVQPRSQGGHGKGPQEQAVTDSSRVPQFVGGKVETTNGEPNQEDRSERNSALTTRKTVVSTEGEQRGSATDLQEPRKPPDEKYEYGDYPPLRREPRDSDGIHDEGVGSLDMDNQSSFLIDDDRNSPRGLSPSRRDRARHGSLSGDDGSGLLLSPQPLAAPQEGEELGSVNDGMHEQQLLPPQSSGDRCSTRGKQQQERAIRGKTGLGRATPRARSQENDGQRRLRDSSPCRTDARMTPNIRREQQERLIQQLTRDNGTLQRKVAGYQLALQLSADEDDFSAATAPSFSAAMKLQQTDPPSFPRDGGTPAPSPRVARGWTHQNPPPATRIYPVERNLSYTTLVRQLDAGGRRARTLKRANEALGARVNELESGAVLRATKSRLAERDEEIVILREELSVMNRLARAQDRKFEGSQGYALTRRLWLAEEELRLARSTISALGAEVYGLRQFRKTQSQDRRRRRSAAGAVEPAPGIRSSTSASRTSPRRPARRRRPSLRGDAAVHSPRIKRQERGKGSSSSSVGRANRSPTNVCFGRSVEASGPSSGGGRTARSVDGAASSVVEDQPTRGEKAEVRAEMLQRALENMRSKAKGELRAAQAEIDQLKEDKVVLGKTLDVKAKEIRMQLLQVNRLKRELRDLSDGAMKLEEASCVVASASRPFRTRGISSAAAGAGQTSATGVTKFGVDVKERRVKSAAVGSSSKTSVAAGVGRPSLNSLAFTQLTPPPRSDNHHPRPDQRAGRKLLSSSGGQSSPMEWNCDLGGDGTEASRAPATPQPRATSTTGQVAERGSPGSKVDTAMAVLSDGEGRGEKTGAEAAEENQAEVNEDDMPRETGAAAQATIERKKSSFRPCPLAGILDMSEPPLRSHRRSYYNENDGNVYILQTGDETSKAAAGIEEPPREEERFKCIIDFKGEVRHGEDCVLRDLAVKKTPPPPSKRASLNTSGRDVVGEELPLQARLPLAIPVRKWHKESTSEWDPAGVGARERLSTTSSRDRSRRASCVSLSEDGRFMPTIGFVRRPTHFSVEAVQELPA
eukprot:g14087.t1